MPRLPIAPELDWSNEAAPRAAAFEDVYFSAAGGLAESEAVFLAGCGLPENWVGRDRFTLCELGLGAGVNLLAAWRAWKKTRLPHAQLHISTIEAFPLAGKDAARALANFPEVADLAEKLLARWPVRAFGPQRLWFPEDGISFNIFIGEAEPVLAGMDGAFDAWFLDGFAPARNPAMWSPAVLGQIARLSAPGARLATFTVAGEVRRGLEAVGFAVEKKPGFGAKRERLEARFPLPQAGGAVAKRSGAAKRVAILGAGIAGASCAHALARRGIETLVLDAGSELGAGASGNPAGLVMPRLDRGGVLAPFFLAAYLHAIAQYEALGLLDACGVEQRADDRSSEALADLLADPPLPPDWFCAGADGAALHLRAGVVRPRAVLEAWLAHTTLLLETRVQTLDQADDGWVLRAAGGRAIAKADAVVLACGAALTQFEAASFLPIALSRGQIEWGEARAPARAITRGTYLAPFEDGVVFGATFDQTDDASGPIADDASRARNLAALEALAPEIAADLNRSTLRSRASLRATTKDRRPIAGALPDAEKWRGHYAGLAQGLPEPEGAPPMIEGLYVLGALGARGLTHAPLLGEALVGEICSEPSLLPRDVRAALHPGRFLLRALKRGG